MRRFGGLRAFIIISLFILCGCASSQIEVDNMDVPLTALQSAVHDNMPVHSLRVSPNGREFYSVFFVVTNDGTFAKAKYPPKRFQAHVLILGDQRPYNLIVRVAVQFRDSDGNYYTDHFDKGMARVITRRIQTNLHERLERRNFIDDFRAF